MPGKPGGAWPNSASYPDDDAATCALGAGGRNASADEPKPHRVPGTTSPPAVSVIIPAYNAAWTIARTLASLRSQTWGDFECVIVDDGSTDETASRVEACVAGDPRFALIGQENAGAAAARNRGLREVRGQYVANLDADDIWRPQFLGRAVDGLQHAGLGAAMCFARSVWIGPDDAVVGEVPAPMAQAGYRDILLHNPIGNGSAALMRRDVVLECGGWDAELGRRYGQGDDWLLQLQLAARGQVVVIDEPLVLYRISPNSASWNLAHGMGAASEVIRRCQRSSPRLPRTDYWMARSIAMLWLLRRAS